MSENIDVSKVILRDAVQADARAIWSVEVDCRKHSHFPNIEMGKGNFPDIELTEALVGYKDYSYRVAEYEGKIIGYTATSFEGMANNSKEAFVTDIALTVDSKTLGRKMLADIEKTALSRKFNAVSMEVYSDVEMSEMATYRGEGYNIKNIGNVSKKGDISKLLIKSIDEMKRPDEVIIRDAVMLDTYSILKMESEGKEFTHFPNINYHSTNPANSVLEIESRIQSPAFKYRVAEYQGEAIGFIGISLKGTFRNKDEVVITDLVMRKNNHEVGGKLLREAEEITASKAFNTISFKAHEDCAIANFDVFRAYGYYNNAYSLGDFKGETSKNTLYFKKKIR